MFFSFPEDARWNAEREAVEFGVGIGEYEGVVRVHFGRPGLTAGRALWRKRHEAGPFYALSPAVSALAGGRSLTRGLPGGLIR